MNKLKKLRPKKLLQTLSKMTGRKWSDMHNTQSGHFAVTVTSIRNGPIPKRVSVILSCPCSYLGTTGFDHETGLSGGALLIPTLSMKDVIFASD